MKIKEYCLFDTLAPLIINHRNKYDNVGRHSNFFHGINTAPTEIMRYGYDNIGRLKQKKIMPNGTFIACGSQNYIVRPPLPEANQVDSAAKAITLNPGMIFTADSLSTYLAFIDSTANAGISISGLQTIDYAHHVKGWLKGINLDSSSNLLPNFSQGDLFSYKLEYETAGLFDGNIGVQKWHNNQSQRMYNFSYDASKRLKSAVFTGVGAEDYSLPNIDYDDNGNILNLQRNGKLGENSFGLMDNLTYAYSGNRLNSVLDAIETNNEVDFVPRGNNTYTYYSNGALKSDANEQIADIVYNTYLNQPSEVFLTDGRKIKHYYDGGGALFKTEYFNAENSVIETYHYIDGIIYKNGAFYQIGIPDGRVVFSNGTWQYEFDYKDHLGNTRASFKADGNTLVQTAKTDFDPFGVVLKSSQANNIANRWELQSKERDLTFGLNWVNYGARRMNPTIGRMDNIDGMASKFPSHSLYNYALNNPLNVIDPDGNESRDIWGKATLKGFEGDGIYEGTTSDGEGDDKDKGKKKEGAKTKENSNKKFIIPHNDGIEPDYTLEAILIPILKPIEWLMSSIKMSLFAGKIAAKSGSNIALGVSEHLDDFAKSIGGSTWKSWGAKDFQSQFLETINNPANKIHFNLNGVSSPWGAVSEGAKGFSASRATSWELYQLYSNPEALKRTIFYKGGKVVPNPF